MLTVVTGGSGSGKSAYAEDLLLSYGPGERIYIATMFPFDEESHRRIARHRQMRRDKGFETVECYTGLAGLVIPAGAHVLLECMSNLVANEMFQKGGAGEGVVEAVLDGVRVLRESAAHVCIVTNEIFSASQAYDPETRKYQENLGKINCKIVEMADEATEVVYGIPLFIKKIRAVKGVRREDGRFVE